MIEVPEPQRKRQALYDVFANADGIAESIGLGGTSPDVGAMERAASNARLDSVRGMAPVLRDHCDFLAGVFIRIQRGQYEAEHGEGSTSQVSDEEWNGTYNHLREMTYMAALSGVTLLIETQHLALVTEDT